ncbi:MAG: hypothetical protein H6760_00830 [Candidatus Nomurabacteria bacterium]|nr:MAG: hypothetical protein H6760_00830 [Candidatus Nomurabacteria bacterium]
MPEKTTPNNIRSFRRWWIRDLQHAWFGLFAVTLLLVACNTVLYFALSYLKPDFGSLFSISSLSGIIRASVNILGDPFTIIGFALLYFALNGFFVTWMTSILHRAILGGEEKIISLWKRYTGVLLISLPALITLCAILVSGIALAYAISRWYFGGVLPILLLTFFFLALFTLWFAYTPFIVIWEEKKGTQALSISRDYARQSRLRLFALFAVLIVLCFVISTELDGLNVWLRGILILITLPAITSLLGTLYAETRSKKSLA